MSGKLKPGDRVTLSLNPTIPCGDYSSVKPMVSITRELGNDPERDVLEMRGILKELYPEQLKIEIMALIGVGGLIADSPDLTTAANTIMEGLQNGDIHQCLEEACDEESSDREEDDREEERKEKTRSRRVTPRKAGEKTRSVRKIRRRKLG